MKNEIDLIKCRSLLGRLTDHGITASRTTRPSSVLDSPDTVLTAQDGRVWLAVLWPGATLRPSLLDSQEEGISFQDVLYQLKNWRHRQEAILGLSAPPLLIIAPSLPASEMPGGIHHHEAEAWPVITQKHCKKVATLAEAILAQRGEPLSPAAAAQWRLAAVPEVRIDTPQRERVGVPREEHALATPLLLDYKQERCARLDLESEPAVTQLARNLKIRVITGVAGCGKTLVLVHRAALLASHFPQARVLLVSFNRPLITDLSYRLARRQMGARVQCLTFYQWLGQVAPNQSEMLQRKEVIRWIERERQRLNLKALAKMSADRLYDEMHWMCDHAYADETYLQAVRKGRGDKLSLRQRGQILQLLTHFRAYLRQENVGEWSEWPLRVKEAGEKNLSAHPFDHILIDEAQFFAPVWIELLHQALKPGGHLFICADPTQGFLRRHISWSALGLEVRNRTHRLEKPYRSTRAILEFARRFYEHRNPVTDAPLHLPSPDWMETLELGVAPIVQPAGPGQDQMARLAKELRALRQSGVPWGDLLILVAGRGLSVDSLRDYLCRALETANITSMKDTQAPPDSLGLAHLMAATGLERPIVFLLGIDDLAAEEANPMLDPEAQKEKQDDHTRQIYVGLTRAMERLVIYTSNKDFLAAFGSVGVLGVFEG